MTVWQIYTLGFVTMFLSVVSVVCAGLVRGIGEGRTARVPMDDPR